LGQPVELAVKTTAVPTVVVEGGAAETVTDEHDGGGVIEYGMLALASKVLVPLLVSLAQIPSATVPGCAPVLSHTYVVLAE
jgi:hypothetical protein